MMSVAQSPSLVLYLILRRDLLTVANWPIGALVAQGCHACMALLWERKDDENVNMYMADVDRMRKVVLEVEGAETLTALSAKLTSESIDHRLWVEQPENTPVCIAVKPYPKKTVHTHLRHLKLFS